MKILIVLREFFWPWLEQLTAEENERQKKRREAERARIEALTLSRDGDIALDEARRMADSEAERRRGTDQKAATYLPLVAALIPLILTVVSTLWENNAGSAPNWLNMLLLGLAVAYTAAAGLWAFRVLKVTISHEAGLGDFELAWKKPHPAREFARRILLYTRLNQDPINWKVSCIKMAHAFLLRAFVTFSLLLILNIVWYLVALVWQATSPSLGSSGNVIATPDHLADRLRTTDAWTALNQECRAQSGGRDTLQLVAGASSPITALPAALAPVRNERGASRLIRLNCAGKPVARLRAWYLPARLVKPSHPNNLPEPLNTSATPILIGLEQDWGPANLKAATTTLQVTSFRQMVLLRAPDGRPAAIIETEIAPGLLGSR